jgi:hypothetical protein
VSLDAYLYFQTHTFWSEGKVFYIDVDSAFVAKFLRTINVLLFFSEKLNTPEINPFAESLRHLS